MRRGSVAGISSNINNDRNATTAANSTALNTRGRKHRKLASAAGSEI